MRYITTSLVAATLLATTSVYAQQAASPAPQNAPNGKSVRPTKAILSGRTSPATPITHHAASSSRLNVNGEVKP